MNLDDLDRESLINIIKALEVENSRLLHSCMHDELTGLPNRNLLLDRLNYVIKVQARNNHIVAVFFIDLDGFKPLNDTYGHDAGDAMLKAVADRLLTCARQTDTIARYAGDEFMVVLSDIKQEENALFIGAKMLSILQQPLIYNEQILSVKASMGVAFCPSHSSNAEHLIKCADTAMYEAKRTRKGGIVVFKE